MLTLRVNSIFCTKGFKYKFSALVGSSNLYFYFKLGFRSMYCQTLFFAE